MLQTVVKEEHRMKRVLVFLLIALFAVGLVFAAGAKETKSDDYEIVVVPKDASNPWFVRMKVGVDEYAKETGLNVYQRGTPQIDATLQAQLVQDLIAQGVDAICVVPVDLE